MTYLYCDFDTALPEYSTPTVSVAEAVHAITSEDVPPSRNLGTFVSGPGNHGANSILAEWDTHNLVNRAEYAGLSVVEEYCLAALAELWHGRDITSGCSTTGSSEAAHIAAAAMLHHWRRNGGGGRPNLVLGPAAHVCWQRFCTLWDVEPRMTTLDLGHPVLDPAHAVSACDENTIGVVATLGSPEFGRYDPVDSIADALDTLHLRTGRDIPLHVDAASGGFVAPFLQPDLGWDFRSERVTSINVSGHKYGLTRPSVGWLLWRRGSAAQPQLSAGAPYIGTGVPEPTLSFSRPAVPVLEQYVQLMRLGRTGFRILHRRSRSIAQDLADRMSGTPGLRLLGSGTDLPVVSFASDTTAVHRFTEKLRAAGWHLPIYRPRDHRAFDVGRIVVRADLTPDLAGQLVDDVTHAVSELVAQGLT